MVLCKQKGASQSGIICWFRFLFESLWLWLSHHCSIITGPALLGSEVHITSVVINMCVRASENVWEWVYVTGSGRLTAQPERACGRPVGLGVHCWGLIISDKAPAEAGGTQRDKECTDDRRVCLSRLENNWYTFTPGLSPRYFLYLWLFGFYPLLYFTLSTSLYPLPNSTLLKVTQPYSTVLYSSNIIWQLWSKSNRLQQYFYLWFINLL